MTSHPLSDLSVLDQYASAPWPPGYPDDRRTFYSPVDNVHGVLLHVIGSAQRSLVITMFGFADRELADLIHEKLLAEHIFVQLTLDSTQAAGRGESKILAAEQYPASSVAIGRSEHGAIIHLKEVVVDGAIHVTGSTNWSDGGERLQDNQCTIAIAPVECAVATARMGAIHANCLQQMAKKAAAK